MIKIKNFLGSIYFYRLIPESFGLHIASFTSTLQLVKRAVSYTLFYFHYVTSSKSSGCFSRSSPNFSPVTFEKVPSSHMRMATNSDCYKKKIIIIIMFSKINLVLIEPFMKCAIYRHMHNLNFIWRKRVKRSEGPLVPFRRKKTIGINS